MEARRTMSLLRGLGGIAHSSCGPDHPNPTALLSHPFTQPSTHEPTSLQPRHTAWNPAQQPDAAFEEDSKGTLTPGKLADVVILSQDILTVPEDQILATQVVATIVGGKVVYDASK